MLHEKIHHFIDYCKLSNFTDKSIETFTIRLNEFNRFLEDKSAETIQDITYQHLREFVAFYGQPSIHVRKARIWSLRQFFHFLKLNDWIEENIATGLPYPKINKTVPHFLTINEYNQLLSYFHSLANDLIGLRNLVIIMMLGILGLRLSSIISLNVEDVDVKIGLIWISEKGRKSRTLILPKILCTILSKYKKLLKSQKGPLFLSKRKKRISPRSLQNIFRQAADKLRIEKHLHANLFRHTAATYLTKVSTPEITQHVLGHMRRENTEKYSHLNPDQYGVYMKKHPYMRMGKEV